MKNSYHEKRILSAIKKHDDYNQKQQKVYYNLLKLLRIDPYNKEQNLRYFFRNYPEDKSYNHLLKNSPQAKKMIAKYQKYYAIKKNYSKLIYDYRKNYLDDVGCDAYRRKFFLQKTVNNRSIFN